MALQTIRIGSAKDIFQYDDADFDSGIEVTAPIKSAAPVAVDDVVRLDDIGGVIGTVITKVATVSGVDMQTAAAKTNLYTVPAGKTFYPMFVVIREPSATLLGGSDYDLGTGALCNTWRQAITLVSMTTALTDYMVIRGADVTKYTDCAAASVFGIYVNTGSTGVATATIDVFGFLV